MHLHVLIIAFHTIDFVVLHSHECSLYLPTGSDLGPPPLPPASIEIWRALLAGGCAGIVSKTVTAPLEKVKIMAQVGFEL